MTSGSAPSIPAGVATAFALLLGGTIACWSDWGNRELHDRVRALGIGQVTSAVLSRPDRPPTTLSRARLQPLLDRLVDLAPTGSIGEGGDWSVYCEVSIQARVGVSFTAAFATRDSLDGRVIVILTEDENNSPRMGFYRGEDLYGWLRAEDLCAAEPE